jgi:hypothetical protein
MVLGLTLWLLSLSRSVEYLCKGGPYVCCGDAVILPTLCS